MVRRLPKTELHDNKTKIDESERQVKTMITILARLNRQLTKLFISLVVNFDPCEHKPSEAATSMITLPVSSPLIARSQPNMQAHVECIYKLITFARISLVLLITSTKYGPYVQAWLCRFRLFFISKASRTRRAVRNRERRNNQAAMNDTRLLRSS